MVHVQRTLVFHLNVAGFGFSFALTTCDNGIEICFGLLKDMVGQQAIHDIDCILKRCVYIRVES